MPFSNSNDANDDPYIGLEDINGSVGSETGGSSLNFAMAASEACLTALGDPTKTDTGTYKRILNVLEGSSPKDEQGGRIPFVSKMGTDIKGNDVLYNLWKDSKNRRGIWRKTTMSSFGEPNENGPTEWTTVLDIDELSRKDKVQYVWKGSRVLPRARDPKSQNGKRVTRALISLSKQHDSPASSSSSTSTSTSTAKDPNKVLLKEFDLLSCEFVANNELPFAIPDESKTRACYKSRDILLIGSDYKFPSSKGDALTEAGYPRTIREWVRGTSIEDAPVVFEGEKSDITVFSYIDDQRIRGGGIYEIRTRVVSLNRNIHYVRKIKYEHLLVDDDPKREEAAPGLGDPPEFKQLHVSSDADVDFVGNLLMITLRSDWKPEAGKVFRAGSLIYVNAHKFIKYGPKDRIYHVLFEPTPTKCLENYTSTQKFVILSIIDNAVQSKLEFYKLQKDANKLRIVGCDKQPIIRSVNVRAVDPYDSDNFWFTTTSYLEPTTLWLGDASKVDTDDKRTLRRVLPEVYQLKKLKQLPSHFDPSDLMVIQKFVPSIDGTKVPYCMIMKKDTILNKKNPTLLYGYGGFEVSLGPNYLSAAGCAWLERSGVYVEANIRGGGEFGPTWHEAAVRENRHKAYEDFIAVAEDLIASKVCKPKTLAIRGGSIGGLLVANMYVMRPDLFGAIHSAVPLLDMKRYKMMGAPPNWISEFGDPDTNDWNEFLKKYSPYHNIDASNKRYPPILFTTTAHDDRVHPGHARKMTKKLWDLGKGKKWPVYFFESATEGTGGVDASQYAFMTALGYDFMFSTLSKNAERA